MNDNEKGVLQEKETLTLLEPTCLEEAIKNALTEADFKVFGVHMTAKLVKRHMDKFVRKNFPNFPEEQDE